MQVWEKVVMSYNPASKLVTFRACVNLPQQVIRGLSKCLVIEFEYHNDLGTVNYRMKSGRNKFIGLAEAVCSRELNGSRLPRLKNRGIQAQAAPTGISIGLFEFVE